MVKKFSSLLFVFVAIAALCGCATAQSAPKQVVTASVPEPATITDINAKLDNAVAIATAGGDAAGAACWSSVKGWVATLPIPAATPVLPEPIGISGEIEVTRIKVEAAQAKVTALKSAIAVGLPPGVTNACAPLVVEAHVVAAKIVGVLALIPQTGIAAAGAAGFGTAAAVLKAP